MVLFYRRLPQFDYVRPRTFADALALLSDDIPVRDQVYAGGTDLVPKLKSRAIKAPPRVIDLKGIPDLDYIRWDAATGLHVGALATIREVARSTLAQECYTALAQGAQLIASNQLQNRGTIVGNICNAVPSADSAPPLLVHDARVICAGRSGERSVPLTEFFVGPSQTSLKPGELVRELCLPPPPPGEHSVYLKLAPRGKMDLAMVGVAAAIVIEGGIICHARIGLGSAAAVPVRAPEAEAALIGRPASPAVIVAAAQTAAAASRTRSSQRASAEYRRMMIEVLVRRAVTHLAAQPVAAHS